MALLGKENVLDFLSLKSPFGVLHVILKNLTDFCKPVETGKDPCPYRRQGKSDSKVVKDDGGVLGQICPPSVYSKAQTWIKQFPCSKHRSQGVQFLFFPIF